MQKRVNLVVQNAVEGCIKQRKREIEFLNSDTVITGKEKIQINREYIKLFRQHEKIVRESESLIDNMGHFLAKHRLIFFE